MLLDDSRRYVERAVSAGVDATLDVWMGMPHGFINGVGNVNAATQTLNAVGTFLSARLERRVSASVPEEYVPAGAVLWTRP